MTIINKITCNKRERRKSVFDIWADSSRRQSIIGFKILPQWRRPPMYIPKSTANVHYWTQINQEIAKNCRKTVVRWWFLLSSCLQRGRCVYCRAIFNRTWSSLYLLVMFILSLFSLLFLFNISRCFPWTESVWISAVDCCCCCALNTVHRFDSVTIHNSFLDDVGCCQWSEPSCCCIHINNTLTHMQRAIVAADDCCGCHRTPSKSNNIYVFLRRF